MWHSCLIPVLSGCLKHMPVPYLCPDRLNWTGPPAEMSKTTRSASRSRSRSRSGSRSRSRSYSRSRSRSPSRPRKRRYRYWCIYCTALFSIQGKDDIFSPLHWKAFDCDSWKANCIRKSCVPQRDRRGRRIHDNRQQDFKCMDFLKVSLQTFSLTVWLVEIRAFLARVISVSHRAWGWT